MGFICKECGHHFDEEEAGTGRDGDAYDASTRFWDTCPVCLSTDLEEVQD
jgi:hypothetical protein